MEATTYEVAALIDRGAEDYMLETAILKVFSTEDLWQGSYEVLPVYGGQGYFSDEPYERMMRDARINTIGEGANEVLKAFIALVGMRDIGEGFKTTLAGLKSPSRMLPTLWRFGRDRLVRMAILPQIPVRTPELRPSASALSRRIAQFASAVERVLIKHREAVLDRQYVQERVADAAIALMTASCTLARLDRDLAANLGSSLPELRAGRKALPPHGEPAASTSLSSSSTATTTRQLRRPPTPPYAPSSPPDLDRAQSASRHAIARAGHPCLTGPIDLILARSAGPVPARAPTL